MGMFEHYDNPARAKRVWNAYREDFLNGDMINAYLFLQECVSVDDLDIKLDLLFGKSVHIIGNPHHSLNNIDIDSNGCYGNAIRALEEGR